MKVPTFMPTYCWLYPGLVDVARACGYSLCIHGTVVRDFDLVAVPWRESASGATVLVESLTDYARRLSCFVDGGGDPHGPEVRPHGRLAWTIPLGNGAAIDLSVMPLVRQGGGAP